MKNEPKRILFTEHGPSKRWLLQCLWYDQNIIYSLANKRECLKYVIPTDLQFYESILQLLQNSVFEKYNVLSHKSSFQFQSPFYGWVAFLHCHLQAMTSL